MYELIKVKIRFKDTTLICSLIGFGTRLKPNNKYNIFKSNF